MRDSRSEGRLATTFSGPIPNPKSEVCVHNGSMANPRKIVNISFCNLLFVDPLKFQRHIGILDFVSCYLGLES